MKRRAVVICPGRGTYNKSELGYLARNGANIRSDIARFSAHRATTGHLTLEALDTAALFEPAVHLRGDNASPLIFACSWADFNAIDRDAIEIVAVTGNSMGWYTALVCAGALDAFEGFRLVDGMGRLMQAAMRGGQVVYSCVDAEWREIPGRRDELQDLIVALRCEGAAVYLSIDLGGMIVIAGEADGLALFEQRAPRGPPPFPMRLGGHAGFHSPLQEPVSEDALQVFGPEIFGSPSLPLIDGRGRLWTPHSTDRAALRRYTLIDQVVEPYDFTAAVRTAMEAFAPDAMIILGPGETLGGAVLQSLIRDAWHSLRSKSDALARQTTDPFVFSMGRPEQRASVASS